MPLESKLKKSVLENRRRKKLPHSNVHCTMGFLYKLLNYVGKKSAKVSLVKPSTLYENVYIYTLSINVMRKVNLLENVLYHWPSAQFLHFYNQKYRWINPKSQVKA